MQVLLETLQQKIKTLLPDRSQRYLQIPNIVYQPGKVGSITVHKSLENAFQKMDLATPTYHAHNLDRIDAIEEYVKKHRTAPENTLKKLNESRALRQQIEADPSQKWNIITLVRDPVALRVSTMFQLLDEYFPNWPSLIQENKLTIADLQQILITKEELDPTFLAGWFNNQVKGLFQFDIFSRPFDTQHGYKIYRPWGSRFAFMVIRLEDLNRVAPRAFYEFTGLKDFELLNHNIGENKAYSQLYKQFKTTPLPASYLERAYDTQYARHFYAPKERESFFQRWQQAHE